jgi:type VI secretion system protein ImpA
MPIEASDLVGPVSAEHPCGENLEDSQLLASFDGYRLFGQSTPLPSGTDWREIRDRALEALHKSRDLRILTHLGAAVIRTDGLASFVDVTKAASTWLETWWDQVYPLVDGDGILRRSALSGLADRMAIIDGLRRVPILVHRQLGSYSIRDVEIASGAMPAAAGEATPPDSTQLNALLTAVEFDALQGLESQLAAGMQSLTAIEKIMRDRIGAQAAPDFAPLATTLARTRTIVAAQIEVRMPATGAHAGNGADPAEGGGPVAVGAIKTREDAVRALDAVAAFFRRNEPSSPIPLFLERAKRLVAKDFLEVLEDIAPDALAQARSAGGVRDGND